MAEKYKVDYWIVGNRVIASRFKFTVHLEQDWRPASFEDCVIVLVATGISKIGFKVQRCSAPDAIGAVREFCIANRSSYRITEFVEHGEKK